MKTALLCTRHPIFCLLTVLAFGILAGGCKHDGKAGSSSADIAGRYQLVKVDGKDVPASIRHEGATLVIRSGEFVVGTDGTCSTSTTFVPPSGREATRTVQATYTRTGSTLQMQWRGAGQTTATVTGRRLSMNNEGMTLLYER